MGISTTNIQGQNVYKRFENEYKEGAKLENDIDNLRKQIASDPNLSYEEKKGLLDKLKTADNCAERVQDLTSTNHRLGFKDDSMDRNNSAIRNNYNRAEDTYYDVLSQYSSSADASKVDKPVRICTTGLIDPSVFAMPMATGPAPSSLDINIDSVRNAANQVQINAAAGTQNTAATTSTSGTSSASSTAAPTPKNVEEFAKMSPDQLLRMQRTNPDEFFKMMNELQQSNPALANATTQKMQDHLQQMNRMFTLMANITQALHDTQKALINNIRV